MIKLLRAGYHVVVFNARGCGGMPLTNKTTYVGDKTHDVKEVVSYVYNKQQRAHSGHKVFLVGYSLGAASTLRYLTRPDVMRSCELTAAACISPPWNIAVHTPVFKFWTYFLVLPMKVLIYQNPKRFNANARFDFKKI